MHYDAVRCLAAAPPILFGKGQRHALSTVAAKHGRRALLCTDERFAGTAVFSEIVAGLKASSIEIFVHDRVQPEVPVDTVGACVEEARTSCPIW